MTSGPEYLFVYGTLMQGYNNPFAQKLQEMSVFEGNGFFRGMLYAVSWYPGAVYFEESTTPVYGEVYRMSNVPELLRELDEYEDVFEDENISLYVRRVVPVGLENGSVVNCWTYLYNQSVDVLQEIESGNFRDFKGA
ncbi:gamma-glutamylcyclotransferase family protein [Dyadobacter psychrotolerans]|uniref:Gamma-glutamylcyclotransferase n=1 Tax=Dyadobacter psychrotolerans TaxID=2541721 RepID=A0A4R5DRG4_9BACT|nr:gamma-glutamylcyclotransferase family protein [Dyadobacter psychrotolerans]TDE13655.1 gamma-glutamylcyclotransferase [Dyadobacter psychrotolerans]